MAQSGAGLRCFLKFLFTWESRRRRRRVNEVSGNQRTMVQQFALPTFGMRNGQAVKLRSAQTNASPFDSKNRAYAQIIGRWISLLGVDFFFISVMIFRTFSIESISEREVQVQNRRQLLGWCADRFRFESAVETPQARQLTDQRECCCSRR